MSIDAGQNPYRAPAAAVSVPDGARVPVMLKLAIALYALYCIGDLVWLKLSSMQRFDMFPFVAVVSGLYGAFMCLALVLRWQWARMVLVLTTVFVAMGLMVMVARRNAWDVYWPTMLLYLLRIGIGGMMFLPSVRRWFAPRA